MQILSVPTIPAAERVVDTEAALVETLVRLERLQVAALTGGAYDPDDYDAAIMAYRHARAAADDARTCWTEARRAHYAQYAPYALA